MAPRVSLWRMTRAPRTPGEGGFKFVSKGADTHGGWRNTVRSPSGAVKLP
jgi:hypothetical protein